MTKPSDVTQTFHVADYVIFASFLVISTGIGVFYACRGGRQRTNNEFLMGNRKFRTLPVAISIVVSYVSGVMFLGHPAEMYTRGSQFSMRMVGHVIACVLSTFIFVPLFFKLKVTSSFEYLEARYKSKCVRLLGTVATLFSMLLQTGIVLYAPAVALQAVNGIPVYVSIIVTSAVAITYTTLGGMKAVVYTDVFQALCMIGGMVAIVIQGTVEVGSLGKVWELNSRDGRIDFFNFNPDPTIRNSFWSTVFGCAALSLSMFGVGQTTVQRYCALPTLKQAKCSVLLTSVFMVVVYALATVVGFVIYAYYASIDCDPIRAKLITSQNQLVPYFVKTVLAYPGLPGALLAVLFGGALSTMSSNLNSAAAVTWQDILKYFFEHLPETRRAIVTKVFVLIYGAIGLGIAFLAKYVGNHVLQGVSMVLGTFSGPTLGMFALGILFPFANSKGAVVGCLTATAFNVWISVGSLLINPHSATLPTSTANCSSASTGHFLQLNHTTPFNYSDGARNNWTTEGSTSLLWEDLPTTSPSGLHELFSATPYTGNDTITSSSTGLVKPLEYLYSISFNLYPLVGLINTLIVGVIVSLLTGRPEDRKFDRRLLVPVLDRLCCCLPGSVRRLLRCGIEYEEDSDDEEEQRTSSEDVALATAAAAAAADAEEEEDARTASDSCCCCWDATEDCDKRKTFRLKIPESRKTTLASVYLNPNHKFLSSNGEAKGTSPQQPSLLPQVELRYLKKLNDYEDIDL